MSSQHRITPRTRAGHWPSLALEAGQTPPQGAPWAPGVREQAPVCLVAEGGVPHQLPGGRARPCVCGCRLPQMGVWGTPRPHPEPALATSRRGRGRRAPTTGSPCHLTPAISYTLQSRIELSTEIRSALARTLLCERTRVDAPPTQALRCGGAQRPLPSHAHVCVGARPPCHACGSADHERSSGSCVTSPRICLPRPSPAPTAPRPRPRRPPHCNAAPLAPSPGRFPTSHRERTALRSLAACPAGLNLPRGHVSLLPKFHFEKRHTTEHCELRAVGAHGRARGTGCHRAGRRAHPTTPGPLHFGALVSACCSAKGHPDTRHFHSELFQRPHVPILTCTESSLPDLPQAEARTPCMSQPAQSVPRLSVSRMLMPTPHYYHTKCSL